MRSVSYYSGVVFLLFITLFAGCSKDDENPSVATLNSSIAPNDFLSGQKYNALTIEIKYVEGFAPSASSLDNLKSFLQTRLNKPSGITFTQSSVVSSGKTTLTFTDIQNLEKANRSLSIKDKSLVAYIYFADAEYSENTDTTKVLGAAYGNSSMIIFEKSIKGLSGGLGKPSASVLESIVMDHEFGHLLGLVNNGSTMQTPHQDSANGKHCTQTDCLMNYKTESSRMIANLSGGTIPSLDANCIADLKANGGK
ncbi:MAG TPA: peptidase [Cyclobacteriaceae bacterium]